MLYDLIIRGGTVYDGTGAPGVRADVAVRDGKLAAIGDLKDARAARELDAAGLAVAPGFIDAHCHSDRSFVLDDAGDSRISQGITTEVCGQCGGSPFPALPQRLAETARAEGVHDRFFTQSFDEYVRLIQAQGQKMGTNLALLVGHGCVRGGVMGYEDRAPTDTELEEMKALLRRDLEDALAAELLAQRHYPAGGADRCVAELVRRLNRETDFPHEVGLFLGYPPRDVEGFIRERARCAKCVGAWKVYGDEEAARKTFALYKRCTRACREDYHRHRSLERLIRPGA